MSSILVIGKRVAILVVVGVGVFSTVANAFAPLPSSSVSVSPRRPSTPSTTSTTSTSLQAFPSPLVSAIGHAIGGTLGTPFVIGATKKGGWYRKINLPTFTPPDRIFAPVWTTLYSCMGIAIARIAALTTSATTTATTVPIVQLWFAHYALNLAWAIVFFGTKRFRLGLVMNYLLVASLGGLIIPLYWRLDKLAALLVVPYLVWLLFATFLNQTICKLNPTSGGYNEAMFQGDLIKLQEKAAKYANGE
jgi:benzodiazapine receptor